MALPQRSLTTIQTDIYNDLATRFGTPIPLLSKSVWLVLSVVLAGFWYILYTYATDAFKQRFIQTCNYDFLKLIAAVVGLTPDPATTFVGNFTITSTSYIGTLPQTTQFLRNDTGVVYQLSANPDIIVGSNTVSMVALESGIKGNLSAGQTVSINGKLPGLGELATVSAITTSGSEGETESAFRARTLLRYRVKPQGGATIDYVLWSLDAPNVVDAYPYPTVPAGGVDLYIEVDNQTDGIPTSGQLAAIYAGYINVDPVTGLQRWRRPVTATVTMYPIYRRTDNVLISALSPDTAEIHGAIEDALTEHYLTYYPYVQGKDIVRNDTIKKSKVSAIVESVTELYNASFDDIVLSTGGVPYSSAVLAKGQKTKFGTLS